MKIFVTGATGFIGSTLVKKLLARGDEVLVLTRRGEKVLPHGTHPILGALDNASEWKQEIEGCDACIHLAAMVSFDPSAERLLLKTNEEETLSLLRVCREMLLKKFLFVSSACTIGISRNGEVLDEATPFDTNLLSHNVYLKSKKQAEERLFSEGMEGVEIITVNPTTVYGDGDHSLNSGTLIKKVIESKVVPAPPGGSNVVDVEDVAEGIVAALLKGRDRERYILGGHNLSFAEIVSTVADVIGEERTIIPLPRFLRYPAVLAIRILAFLKKDRLLQPQLIDDIFSFKYYSSAKAERELDWKAKKSFARSVREAIDYYKANGLVK